MRQLDFNLKKNISKLISLFQLIHKSFLEVFIL